MGRRAARNHGTVADLFKKDGDLSIGAAMLSRDLIEGDQAKFLHMLREACEAFGGIQAVARAAGLHEKTLYKVLTDEGNPSLSTLLAVSKVMGLRLAVVPPLEYQNEKAPLVLDGLLRLIG